LSEVGEKVLVYNHFHLLDNYEKMMAVF